MTGPLAERKYLKICVRHVPTVVVGLIGYFQPSHGASERKRDKRREETKGEQITYSLALRYKHACMHACMHAPWQTSFIAIAIARVQCSETGEPER